MNNSNSRQPKPSSGSGKSPASAAMPPRKSRWGPPPAAGYAAPTREKPTQSTSRHTPTPTPSSDSRRHHPAAPAPSARNPAAPAARNTASPVAAAIRPPHQHQQLPPPQMETPPPPQYGFHNLDRRTMLLADGTVRTYFALPPDYPFDPTPLHPLPPHLQHAGTDAWPPPPHQQQQLPLQHDAKRKHRADPDEGFSKHPKQLRFDSPHHQPSQQTWPQAPAVDRQALRRVFLRYSKMLNENPGQRRSYLEGGRVPCIACGRSSKDFADVHGLVMHAYNPPNADSFVDHLGLHKALCVLMGWDYTKVPENSRAYQSLPLDLVRASREDLVIWPPTVIIHNTATGRKKDGRSEGLGNKEMDKKIAELGFAGGKSKSLYGKDGHLGLTLIRFAGNPTGLKEAERLAEFFERQGHGRVGWSRAQATQSVDSDKNPLLVETDNRGEKRRILYGYIAISCDLDELDSDSRKRASVKSRQEFDPSD